MRKHPTSALIHDLECSDDADGIALRTRGVDERQAIQGERGVRVRDERSVLLPLRESVGGCGIGVTDARGEWHVHVHDIVAILGRVTSAIRVAQDVVWRRGERAETTVVGVASRAKWLKARHNDSVPSPAILCDIDGVIWLMHEPIPGSVEAISRLRDAGHRVVFVTNNSFATVREQESALERIGIAATGDVVTSSQAAGTLVSAGDRVLMGGGPGVREAIESAGGQIVATSDGSEHVEIDGIDAVVVGYHSTFDYRGLTRMSAAVRKGARLIATNDDATYPTPKGLIPGGGSILAAVATASGVAPVVAGKPHQPMADLVRRVLGNEDLSSSWMIGDRSSTDGLFAQRVGCRFAHVMTGVVRESRPEDRATLVADNLAAAAEEILRSTT